MVWLNVPDPFLLGRPPSLGPPIRRLVVARRVGVVCLFFGCHCLDPCLGDELAGVLLDALESLTVEIPQRGRVSDAEAPFAERGNGRIVIVGAAPMQVSPLPLPTVERRGKVVVRSVQPVVSAAVHPPAARKVRAPIRPVGFGERETRVFVYVVRCVLG